MSTHLHPVDALCTLAEDPNPTVRGWANTRLAVVSPEQVRHMPTDDYDAATCLAAGAQGAVDDLLHTLQTQPITDTTARHVEKLGAFGMLPTAPAPWIEALRGAVGGEGAPGDLYLAQALADLGALDGPSLSAAAQARGPDAALAVPALVMRFAHAQGEAADAADSLADQVSPLLKTQAIPLNGLLSLLGVPQIRAEEISSEKTAARLGASLAGGDSPTVRAKGAPRRRAQRWVHRLLEGVDHPAAHLLSALARRDLADTRCVAAAGWLHALPRGLAPLTGVLGHALGEDRTLLSTARQQVQEADLEPIIKALGIEALSSSPASVLTSPLLEGETLEPLREALLDRFVEHPGLDLRTDLYATLAMARSPELVRDLLDRREMRDVGLLFARLVPTEEVLSSLLAMAVPADPGPRALYAWALAEMADTAALPTLIALREQDPSEELHEAVRHAGTLLGQAL